VAQGVPGRLKPRIFLTFGTTRVVGRQPYAPAAFTPGEIPGTHFQRLSRPQGTWFRRGSPSDTTRNRSRDRLVTQCSNHYATPGPGMYSTVGALNDGLDEDNFTYSVYFLLLLSHFELASRFDWLAVSIGWSLSNV
jgi:hypothetical protein